MKGSNGNRPQPCVCHIVETDVPLAGIVARLDPQKGHIYLLTAFAKVVETLPQARLLVVGDGYLRGDLERQVKELEIVHQAIFTGWRNDVPYIMADLDLLILPSLWEGFGLVLLEGMALAKPIVATRVSAIPEIVVDGETEVLIPPKDSNSLAKAVTKLLQNPVLTNEVGRKGRERLKREFSVEEMVKQTERVHERLMEERSSK